MPRRLIGLLPETSFLRKLSMLASGTLLGQVLVIVSSPLLTRLFTPEEFGLFAVFGALAGIGGVVVGLRYEFAIAVMEEDRDAAAMVMVTAATAALMTLVLTLVIWLLGAWFANLVNVPALAPWLWLLPPSIFVWGLGSALTYWSVRRQTYAINAINRTLQLGSQAGVQLGLGFVGTGGAGLIVGYALGYAVRLGHFLHRLPAEDLRLIRAQPPAALWRNVRTSWQYPVMAFPSSALQSVCQHAPAMLIAALYGPAIAGLYALSQRIMGLPVKMLSEAASKVFLGEARGLGKSALHRHFLRTMLLFVGLGVVGMLPILLFGPILFAWIFGAAWRDAGVIAQILIPLYLSRFVVQPLSLTLYIFNRQEIHLLSSTLNMGALIGSFSLGYVLMLDAYTTIFLFSVISGLSFLFNLTMAWYLTRQGALAAEGQS